MPAFDFPATPTVGQRYTANGVTYIWSGVAWLGDGGVTPMASKMRVSIYNTVGTIPYVPPADLKGLQVELFGSGGGGGGCTATVTTSTMSCGGGGAAGGYARKYYNRADLAATQDLVLGAGGAPGDGVSTNGLQGDPSSFKGLTCNSGFGGAHGAASAVLGAVTARGFPTTGAGGDYNDLGGSGQLGVRFNNGSPTLVLPGYGGRPYLTGTIFGTTATTKADQTGSKASQGCGGHGSGNGLNQAAPCAGMAGGDAFAIFTEYLYDADEIQLPELLMNVTSLNGNSGPGGDIAGNYVKPAGLKYLQVELWAGGGAGQHAAATSAAQVSAGAGGAGGGYIRKIYAAEELSASEPYVIGHGGNTPAAVAEPGGDTTFKTLNANGGGAVTTGSAAPVANTTYGASLFATGGGASSGGVLGTVGIQGDSSDIGICDNGVPRGGMGGGGAAGGGNSGTRIPAGGSFIAGQTGRVPGGGGSGGANSSSQAAGAAGGVGAGGRIVFTEYFVDIPSINDDIETWGDWTPVFQFGGANVGMGQAANKGRWRKRGKLVTAWFDIQLTAKGTSTGAAAIVALPHPVASSVILQAGTIGYTTGVGAGYAIMGCYVNTASGGYIQITAPNSASGVGTALNTATDVNFSNTTRIIGKIEYEAAA